MDRGSRDASRRVASVGLALATSACVFASSHRASAADTTNACLASYEQTQSLRKAGKLRDARVQALQCARDVCPGVISKECGRWVAELDGSIPSVVFEARASDGTELVKVKVSMDDKPLVERLDGKAVEVEPGAHTFRFQEADGAAPVTVTGVIREGEKNRKIVASFANASSSGAVVSAADPDKGDRRAERSERRPVPLAAYVFGGVGVAALAVGTVFAISGKSQQGDLDACKPNCAAGDVDGMSRSFLVADVAFGAAIVSAAAAIYLVLSRPKVASWNGAGLPFGPSRETRSSAGLTSSGTSTAGAGLKLRF